MSKQLKICVSRNQGGLGDQICCEPVIRAVREKYPDAHITWVCGEPWLILFYDQKHCADDVVSYTPWEDVYPKMREKFDLVLELDGPEVRHALENDYDLKESRIESWCKYVDKMPNDLCPRWLPKDWERNKIASYLSEAGLRPFNYIVVQWASAEKKKDYLWMKELICLLKDRGHDIIVVHHDTSVVPDLGVYTAIGREFREIGCMIELATCLIGPDSSLQHFAAAVKTPSLGLFGPTSPEIYLKGYPLAHWIWNKDVKGHDCEHSFPCYGVKFRNHWCGRRPESSPWCLEQVKPETIADTYEKLKESYIAKGFYEKKLHFVSKPGSELFFSTDPKIDLLSLREVGEVLPIKGLSLRTKSVNRRLS